MGISVPSGRQIGAGQRFSALEAWETPEPFAVGARKTGDRTRGAPAAKPLEDVSLGFAEPWNRAHLQA